MKASAEKEGLDETTRSRFREVRLELKRSQIMDVLDEFSCQCVAVSKQGTVPSDLVRVDVACKYSLFYFKGSFRLLEP